MAKRRSFQENRKGSIKQTNTSQVLVSETVPDRRVQPSRRAKMTRFGDNPVTSTVSIPPRRQPGRDTSTRNRRNFKLNVTDPDLLIPIKQTAVTKRHSDLREPQPSSSDSQPASSQPVSETTTSESSVSLPSSPSAQFPIWRGTALTSDQEGLTYLICIVLSYSVTRSLQQPVMKRYHLREKTRSFQDALR